MPYPHHDRIRQALGVGVPFRGVVDPRGCAARGTPAFTDRGVSHFASATPSLEVATHEAAHQVQHAGLTNDAGLGPEGHASAVTNLVRTGRSARPLLGARGTRVAPGIRHYVDDPEGRLSETGETLTPGGHTAWATAALIAQAALILKNRRSGVSLSAGGNTKTKAAPDGSGEKTLSELKVRFDIDPSGEKFYGDCRQAAQEVMGGKGQPDVIDKAIVAPGGTPTAIDAPEWDSYVDIVGLVIYTQERIRKHGGYAQLSDEEKKKFIADVRWDFKWKLSPSERKEYRKKAVEEADAKELGINEYAMPKVGEAFAVIPPAKTGDYVFHFATVIMAPGSDRVTLENAGAERNTPTEKWSIQTYGARGEQTFHARWGSYFGPERKTLVIGNQPEPPPGLGDVRALPTRELLQRYDSATDPAERYYLKQEIDLRSVQVLVEVVTKEDWTGDDDVFLQIGKHETGAVAIPEGQSHWFFVSLGALLPLSDPFIVNVYEWDVDFNDLIGSISMSASAPYSIQFKSLTGDDAHYDVTVIVEDRVGGGR